MEELNKEQLDQMGITEEVYRVARKLAQKFIDQADKTWIVVEWKYYLDQTQNTATNKIAKRLYCIETQEYRYI